MSFRYLTADRLKMHLWTRKRRLKFRKRWRKQHAGHNFTWLMSEFKYAIIPTVWPHGMGEVILHIRNEKVGLGASLKEG